MLFLAGNTFHDIISRVHSGRTYPNRVELVDGVRMDTQSTPKRIVAVAILLTAFLSTGYPDFVIRYGGRFDLPIPDPTEPEAEYGKGWMKDAQINVPDHIIINDIDVEITIEHSCVFDLQLYLKPPTGPGCWLNGPDLNNIVTGENYTDTIFDDEADIPIEQALPPYTGRFKPQVGSSLSVFDAKDAFGVWTLKVYDWWYADTGTLKKFQLLITSPVPEPTTLATFCFATALLLAFKPGPQGPICPGRENKADLIR